MGSLTKRKKQLLSIVLCVCMIMTSIMVERKEVKAETYYISGSTNVLTKHEGSEYESYYEFGTGENAKKVFTSEDLIKFNDSTEIKNLYVEGVRRDSTSLPEGKWLISEVGDCGGSYVSIVSATAEPKVYLVDKDDKYVLAKVGDAGEDGMASVTFPSDKGDEETREFYAGLDIKVRKCVDKLDPKSFKISVKGNGSDTDYAGMFNYFSDVDPISGYWSKGVGYDAKEYLNQQANALGGILSEKVKIYLNPPNKGLLVKAIADEGGSISPQNAYYAANDSSGKTYTITASEGYEISDVKKCYPFNSEGITMETTGTASECSVTITPESSFFSGSSKRINVAKLEASFKKKKYPITFGAIGANGGVYTAYISSGKTTYSEKYTTGREDSLEKSVEYGADSDTYYFKADGEKYKVVLKDNNVIQSLGSPNDDGYYQYQLKGVDKEHQLAVSFNETTIVNKATGGYKTTYVYNGKPLPAPTENNFTINSVDNSAEINKPEVTFEWYPGETVDVVNKLNGAPSDVGTYTLKVSVAETDEYFASSKNFTIKINKFEPGESVHATLKDTNKGNDNWYIGDVTLQAPNGYKISTNQTGESWSDSLTIKEDRNGDYTYYLKEESTEYISEAKSITIMRDTTAPGGEITVSSNSFDSAKEDMPYDLFFKDIVDVKITAQDKGTEGAQSGISKIEYQKVQKGETYNENGTWTEYYGSTGISVPASDAFVIYARITDKAGNHTVINSNGVVVYKDSAIASSQVEYTYKKNEDYTLNMTLNGNTFDKLMDVSGNTIPTDNYTLDATGKLTLKAAYLDTLQAGEHGYKIYMKPCGIETDKVTLAYDLTVKVEKAEKAPEMPGSAAMDVPYGAKKVSDVTLPEGWKWQDADKDKELTVGTAVTANAVYNGADKGNYQKESMEISITLQACIHATLAKTERKEPTYTETGRKEYWTCPVCGKHFEDAEGKTEVTDLGTLNLPKLTGGSSTGDGSGNGSGIGSGSQGESSKSQWDVIKDKIADAINKGGNGEPITIDMKDSTTIPADIFADIKGQDIKVVLDLGNGIKWTIDGKDVTNVPNGQIDFGVQTGTNSIPMDIINNITGERYSMQISLNHDGEFGFKAVLTVNLEKKNAGYYANLFYYNEQTKELEFMAFGKINEDGNVDLDFNHASDYVIVIDDKPLDGSKDAETEAGTAVSTQDPSAELDKKAFVTLKDKKLSLTWGKVEEADGYDIFAAQCGKESLAKALAVTVKGQKTSVDLEKVSGKKISDKISYKVRIKAYKLVDGKKTYIGSSLVYYTVGNQNKTYTNVKMVKITKTSVTLSTGKTKKVKAAIERQSPKKKLLNKGNDLRYFSMNKRIATVTENGKIEAKKKGTCFVYVTALNGRKAKVKVTVK